MKNIVKLTSLYIGLVIGAGFASGREILEFFTLKNRNDMTGIVLAGILFSFIAYLILIKAQNENTDNNYSMLLSQGKFEIVDKVMKLSSKSEIGDIKENITISLRGNDLNIAFNARYFTEALRAVTDEFLKLEFTSSVSPCIIQPNEGDEFLYLILPVRIMN